MTTAPQRIRTHLAALLSGLVVLSTTITGQTNTGGSPTDRMSRRRLHPASPAPSTHTGSCSVRFRPASNSSTSGRNWRSVTAPATVCLVRSGRGSPRRSGRRSGLGSWRKERLIGFVRRCFGGSGNRLSGSGLCCNEAGRYLRVLDLGWKTVGATRSSDLPRQVVEDLIRQPSAAGLAQGGDGHDECTRQRSGGH